MKITERFKRQLLKAKAQGYKNVFRVVGAYRATTYCIFHDIDSLLNDDVGTDYGCGRPWPMQGMWTGHDNTRMVDGNDIMFSEVYKL